jgi:hypothetical protein
MPEAGLEGDAISFFDPKRQAAKHTENWLTPNKARFSFNVIQ